MRELTGKDYELIAEAQKAIRLNYDELNYCHTVGSAVRCKNGKSILASMFIPYMGRVQNKLQSEPLLQMEKEILKRSSRFAGNVEKK